MTTRRQILGWAATLTAGVGADNSFVRAAIAAESTEFTKELPTARSRVQMGGWRPHAKKLRDMAYSITGAAYVSPTAVYYDPADEECCSEWVNTIMGKVRAVKVGSQMNDDNMPIDKGSYLSAPAARCLDELRAKYDPKRRFASFLR